METVKLQLTVAAATDNILAQMLAHGLYGRNRAEVASWIIANWIWGKSGNPEAQRHNAGG